MCKFFDFVCKCGFYPELFARSARIADAFRFECWQALILATRKEVRESSARRGFLCANCVQMKNKTTVRIAANGCFSSGTSGNRTSDTRIFSPLLYQLSYGTIVSGGCRSLLQTLRAIAMLCLTRCECKGKQKISTSKRFGLFLHFIFIGALDCLMLNLYDYVCKCMLCNLLCEICGRCEVSRRGGFRL